MARCVGAGHPRLALPPGGEGSSSVFSSSSAAPGPTPGAASPGTAPIASRRGKRGSEARTRAAHALFVGRDTMLRLASAGVIPQGRTVSRTPQRPSGIQLFGVKALGIGLEEGDVLTEVEGRTVTAEPEVVSAVVVALARHARTISARFYRKGERWTLIVEIPYDFRPG